MVTFRVTDTAGYNGFSNYLLLSARQFGELQHSPVLDGAIATDNWDMASTGDDLPEAVHTGKLSANAFEYFRRSSGDRAGVLERGWPAGTGAAARGCT